MMMKMMIMHSRLSCVLQLCLSYYLIITIHYVLPVLAFKHHDPIGTLSPHKVNMILTADGVPMPQTSKRYFASALTAAATAAAVTRVEYKKVADIALSELKQQQQQQPIQFTVEGEPTALERHRTLKTGITYNPSAKKQTAFMEACSSFMPPAPLLGPLEASIVFHFKRPKNHYGTTKKDVGLLKPDVDHWHSKRKDLDNLVKFVLDSLNRVAYEDDGQIARIVASKQYAERGFVEVNIKPLL